jgi:hypothetical protein
MRTGWAAVLLGALLTWAVPVHGQNNGTLSGQVVNGTAGGPAAGGGLTVTLYITDGETELDPVQTTTDALGGFRFEGLDTDAALVYWPEVTYLGVAYASGTPLGFETGQSEMASTITVYETTDDGSSLRVESVHMIAESFDQVLRISEVHVFGNVSDRAFTGQANEAASGKLVTVFIPLPENAVGIAFPEDEAVERYVEVESGIWDTQPVLPGTEGSVVRFSYHLVVEGASVQLERRFFYPVSALSFLAVQPGLTLRGEQLLAGEPVTFQDKEYEVYQVDGLGSDIPLSIELVPTSGTESSGMPDVTNDAEAVSVPAAAGQQAVLRSLGFGLAALALLGAVVYPLITRPRGRT